MSYQHDHPHEHVHPSAKALISNFRDYDAPFFTKVALALRNNWIKIRTHSNCCGNHGQPGC